LAFGQSHARKDTGKKVNGKPIKKKGLPERGEKTEKQGGWLKPGGKILKSF